MRRWFNEPVRPRRPEAFSAWLDAIRWVSALLVVLAHAGGILLLPLSDTPAASRTLLHFGYSFVGGMGHYAVIVFFVMSGYLVGGSLIRDFDLGRLDLRSYALRRATRLYVVLLPALLLSGGAAILGMAIYPGVDGRGVYTLTWAADASGATAACNAVFLQGVLCSQYAGNVSLWSLYNEGWYYALFPLLILPLYRRGGGVAFGCFLAAATMLVLSVVQTSIAPLAIYFFIWGIGAFASFARLPDRMPAKSRPILLAAVFILLISVLRVAFGPTIEYGAELKSYVFDLVVGLLFGYLIVSMRDADRLTVPPVPALHKRLAGMSYTTYCVHVPLLLLFASAMMALTGEGYRPVPDGVDDWIRLGAGLLATLGAAYVLAQLTEAHTDGVRRYLVRQGRRFTSQGITTAAPMDAPKVRSPSAE
jgi:peptidoglycan/LPS O-acetylase OafA/YrhL